MSKHHHSTTAHEIAYIITQVKTLSEEEVQSLYGIELLEDGKVFDPTYNQEFPSVGEWVAFNVEQDGVEYEEHFNSRGLFNDTGDDTRRCRGIR